MEHKTLENQLFEWDGWDQVDTTCFQFYNPVLVCKIGEFEAGTEFDWATFDMLNSELVLCDFDEVEHKFDLKIRAVKKT